MILNVFSFLVKSFIAMLAALAMSILLITIGSMTYGGIIEAVKSHQTESK